MHGLEAPAGQYRVLPKWSELLDASEESTTALRSADKEVNERAAKLRERLIQKGPDRRIAQPCGWREAIDQLEVSLPHFREPIRLLRNSLAVANATKRAVRVPPCCCYGVMHPVNSTTESKGLEHVDASIKFIGGSSRDICGT